MKHCSYTTDGYCLRDEKDYCQPDECRCPHLLSHTKVIDANAGCELTVQACDDCGMHLTEPKTDC